METIKPGVISEKDLKEVQEGLKNKATFLEQWEKEYGYGSPKTEEGKEQLKAGEGQLIH